MVKKEELHLGQKVFYGADREEAVIDGLTQTVAGLIVNGKGYVFSDYMGIFAEA